MTWSTLLSPNFIKDAIEHSKFENKEWHTLHTIAIEESAQKIQHSISDISKSLETNKLPPYKNKLWGKRPLSYIKKIIVHQELSEGDTFAVNKYHISPECHLKPGIGAPKICYHYTIEKDGKIFKCNDHEDILWAVKGENMNSLFIMLVGDFDGPGHIGKSKPTNEQLSSLEWLIGYLINECSLSSKEIYGHCDFGKPACPGYVVMKLVNKLKTN